MDHTPVAAGRDGDGHDLCMSQQPPLGEATLCVSRDASVFDAALFPKRSAVEVDEPRPFWESGGSCRCAVSETCHRPAILAI